MEDWQPKNRDLALTEIVKGSNNNSKSNLQRSDLPGQVE